MPPTEQFEFDKDGLIVKRKLLSDRYLDVVREECDDAIIRMWRSKLDIIKDCGCILECPVLPGEYSLECYRSLRSQSGLLHPVTPIIEAVAVWVKDTLGISQQLYFLNEQYICKPSKSAGSAFKWHTDSEYIMAGDVSLDYVSVWIPLDKVSQRNGGLIVRPFRRGKAGTQSTGISLSLEAGAAVLLSSFLLHCSSPNMSGSMRRAWMLQYSTDKKISGGEPYKYVVPCGQAISKSL